MQWWTNQQLKFGSAKTRLELVEKLGLSESPAAVPSLILALKVPEANVRCAAAKALRGFKDERAVDPLIKVLKDPVALVRMAAAQTLSHLSDPKATEKLEALLRDDAEPLLRSVAARSLKRLGWRPVSDAQRIQLILALGTLEQLIELGAEGVQP